MHVRPAELLHYARFFVETRFLGRRKPLVGGINITSYCNLSCRHCPYVGDTIPREHLSREQIHRMWDQFLAQGVKILFLQGGEPTLWRDDGFGFNDLVLEAKERFYQVACVTNAILPIENPCDQVWVSVDGSPAVHDQVRGEGSYARMAENVRASRHPQLYANLTLSRINVHDLENTVRHIVQDMPNFRGISVNFQIPYPGVEEHSLDYQARAEAVERIVALKRQGYPILNSTAALKLMLRPGWNKTHWLIHLAHPDGMLVEGCGARLVDPTICNYCGYGVMAEVQAIYRGSPEAILGAFRQFRILTS